MKKIGFLSFGHCTWLRRRPIGYFCPDGPARSIVGVGLAGFVMAEHAARRGAELAVASHVAGNAADDGALEASLGLGWHEGGDWTFPRCRLCDPRQTSALVAASA